jgi:hypothetical protein
MKRLAIAPLGALIMLAGCRGDPATETPITMKPGLYEVQTPGISLAGVGMSDSSTPGKKLCLRSGDGDFFAHRVVREALATDGCADPVNERAGNQLTSTIRCSIKDNEVSGDYYFRGRGRISEDAFASDFKIDLSEIDHKGNKDAQQGMQMLQAMQGVGSLRISASRVGECPA